jgi:actin-related protein
MFACFVRMCQGVVDALEEELVGTLPYKVAGANTVNVILNPKKVHPSDLSWRGAAILAHGDTTRYQLVVTSDAYRKQGHAILREKAPFAI